MRMGCGWPGGASCTRAFPPGGARGTSCAACPTTAERESCQQEAKLYGQMRATLTLTNFTSVQFEKPLTPGFNAVYGARIQFRGR